MSGMIKLSPSAHDQLGCALELELVDELVELRDIDASPKAAGLCLYTERLYFRSRATCRGKTTSDRLVDDFFEATPTSARLFP